MKLEIHTEPLSDLLKRLSELPANDRRAILRLLAPDIRRRIKSHLHLRGRLKHKQSDAAFGVSLRCLERGLSEPLTRHVACAVTDGPGTKPAVSAAVADFIRTWCDSSKSQPASPGNSARRSPPPNLGVQHGAAIRSPSWDAASASGFETGRPT